MHEFLETISVIDMLASDEFIWLNSELTDLLEFACLNGSHAIQRLIKITIKDRNAFLPIFIEYFGAEILHMLDKESYYLTLVCIFVFTSIDFLKFFKSEFSLQEEIVTFEVTN